MLKSFLDYFHIYKWIFFAILTFVIIEEMASGLGTTTGSPRITLILGIENTVLSETV